MKRLLGLAVLALLVSLAVRSAPEIARYLKIRSR
jgi:hypothetical protein